MKILITGGAGFIGWQTSRQFLSGGHTVLGIDDLNDYYDVRLKTWRLEDLKKAPGFSFVRADIRNKEDVRHILEQFRPEGIVNLAARAGVRASLQDPGIYFQTNIFGTLNLLQLCVELGIRKFILASTSSLYAGQKIPFSEALCVNTPISPYAASKKSAEVTCYTFHYLYGIDVTIFRYFTVFGPAGRPDLSMFKFIKLIDEGKEITVYGDGTQSRDFTYVDDIARGTCLGMKNVGFEIVNLGGNEPHTLNEMISLVEKGLGKKARIAYGKFPPTDIKETWADISKAQRIFGWNPAVSFEEGIRRTIAWYMENKAYLKDLVLKD